MDFRHHAIDPISPCLTLASALTRGTALPDNILLHLTITGYNTLPATNTTLTLNTHSNSTLDSIFLLTRHWILKLLNIEQEKATIQLT